MISLIAVRVCVCECVRVCVCVCWSLSVSCDFRTISTECGITLRTQNHFLAHRDHFHIVPRIYSDLRYF